MCGGAAADDEAGALLIVWCEEGPEKIALKPTRTQSEAVAFGRHLLKREAKRGSRVELVEVV